MKREPSNSDDLAVALGYRPEIDGAPRVIATGRGPWAAGPDGGQERDPVPDLDQRVPRAVAAEHLGHHGSWKHHVAPGEADHLVAVANASRGRALCVGGPHDHLESRRRPTRCDRAGVDL